MSSRPARAAAAGVRRVTFALMGSESAPSPLLDDSLVGDFMELSEPVQTCMTGRAQSRAEAEARKSTRAT
eukprot:6074007-Prymnesium_polylepis.1